MKYVKLVEEIRKNTKELISRKSLYETYLKIYKNENIRSFNNVMTYLKNNNIIMEIAKDEYLIVTKNVYEHKEDIEINKMYKLINTEYPEIKFTIWNTEILNEFTLHYVINNYIVVEVEKIALELVASLLKEKYLNKYTVVPQDVINRNREIFFNDEKIIVVKPLVLKAPLQKIKQRKYPTIEKIMLDIYIDKLYIQYQGKELQTIYQNIFQKYDINMNKLIRYADARTNLKEYKEYIYSLDIPEKYKLKEE